MRQFFFEQGLVAFQVPTQNPSTTHGLQFMILGNNYIFFSNKNVQNSLTLNSNYAKFIMCQPSYLHISGAAEFRHCVMTFLERRSLSLCFTSKL